MRKRKLYKILKTAKTPSFVECRYAVRDTFDCADHCHSERRASPVVEILRSKIAVGGILVGFAQYDARRLIYQIC